MIVRFMVVVYLIFVVGIVWHYEGKIKKLEEKNGEKSVTFFSDKFERKDVKKDV